MSECEICNDELVCEWSDVHGEGVCLNCGTPYQLLQYDDNNKRIVDAAPKINIKPEYIPLLKKYWSETGEHMGLGTYLLESKHLDRTRAFHAWLDSHPVPLDAVGVE